MINKPGTVLRCGVFALFSFLSNGFSEEPKSRVPVDWKSEWAANENFSIERDSKGFHFPTSIAFVPQPGTGPKDVLYFVTELRGALKVVTNDRSVYTFAENFFNSKPSQELPAPAGQVGMAGVCLEPQRGYVFVTFAYQDAKNITYNNIVRFTSTPQTFSLKPSAQLDFTDIFSNYESSVSHQIGNCQIVNDQLYVGVGDAHKHYDSQKLDNFRGKILRFQLDGKPVPENPFYVNADTTNPANYIFAYGLRNPFGLRIVQGRLFVAENGSQIDRFNEIEKGENYLWDGSDWSIGTKAALTFRPNIGPVQLDYIPFESRIFPPEYANHFFVATSTKPSGIVSFEFNFDNRSITRVPKRFLQYTGSAAQAVAGLAFGPDGLYFAPLSTDAILKIKYSPTHPHPFLISKNPDPRILLINKGCYSCHSWNQQRAGVGPSLSPPAALYERIKSRLNSEEYRRSVLDLDKVDLEPYKTYAKARRDVLNSRGVEQVRLWTKYHLMEPRFDNPNSQMPNLGLTEDEALRLSEYLIGKKVEENIFLSWFRDKVKRIFPHIRYRHLLFSFVGGIAIAILGNAFMKSFKKK